MCPSFMHLFWVFAQTYKCPAILHHLDLRCVFIADYVNARISSSVVKKTISRGQAFLSVFYQYH